VRILSVRVTIISISSPSNSPRAFSKDFTEYKCVSQVLKDLVSSRYFVAVLVETYGKHTVNKIMLGYLAIHHWAL
jgi:hypothetical protein